LAVQTETGFVYTIHVYRYSNIIHTTSVGDKIEGKWKPCKSKQ